MTEQAAAAPSEREKRIAARKARIKEVTPRMLRVRVEPTSDAFRKALRHPVTGMKFPETGSAEWPLDQFTMRRVKDGCVQIEGGMSLAEFLAAERAGTLPAQPGIDNTLPTPEPPPAARASRRSQEARE